MTSITGESGSGVYVPFPLPDERLFRNQATEDILQLFLRNPHEEFTVTELRTLTDSGGDTVQTAIDVLESSTILETRQEGRKRLVSANRDRFCNPDDPVLAIPQEEFRDPVRAFLTAAKQRSDSNLVGIILFGSVARGTADRASDVDIQVIVDDDVVQARRELQDIRQTIEHRTFGGHRYEFQLLVESVDSATNYGEKLQDIFTEGITLHTTDELAEIREGVLHGK